MSDTPLRPPTLAAVLALLSGGSSVLRAAPPPPVTAQRVPAVSAAVSAVPPEVAERLRKAGLDAKDPNLANKLNSLAASTGAAFVRSHVMSSRAARIGPVAKAPGPFGSGASRSSSSLRVVAASLPVSGVVDGVYDDAQNQLASPAPISSTHGHHYPGQYYFLVRTKTKVAVKGGPMFSIGNIGLNYGCSAQTGIIMVTAAAGDDSNFLALGMPSRPPANGSYFYWVSVWFSDLPIGQPRNAQATIHFENVEAPVSLVLQPGVSTVTLAVTIDHSPKLTGVGIIYPWGSTGLGASNAQLASAGTERVGTGNWETQTQGDDLLGVGVGLGAGWQVVSTKISGAVSATSPQDLSPDNTWRGASVTTPPAGSDLRTAVHWHYSGIDSLDYTIEWTLSGPEGQRPLLTLAKYGSCDQ